MAKMTKTQIRRAYNDIVAKAEKLRSAWTYGGYGGQSMRGQYMSTTDLVAIEKIISKYQKKL